MVINKQIASQKQASEQQVGMMASTAEECLASMKMDEDDSGYPRITMFHDCDQS